MLQQQQADLSEMIRGHAMKYADCDAKYRIKKGVEYSALTHLDQSMY